MAGNGTQTPSMRRDLSEVKGGKFVAERMCETRRKRAGCRSDELTGSLAVGKAVSSREVKGRSTVQLGLRRLGEGAKVSTPSAEVFDPSATHPQRRLREGLGAPKEAAHEFVASEQLLQRRRPGIDAQL